MTTMSDDNPLPVVPPFLSEGGLEVEDVLDKEKTTDDVEHVEMTDLGRADSSEILKSNYAHWKRKEVTRKFWRIYMFGLLVSCAGGFAGYIDAAPGGVVANQSFIKQFGTVHDPKTGKLALNADYVSLWGVAQQISPLIPNAFSPIIADRYGRRLVLWLYLGFAAVTIVVEILSRNWKHWFAARFFAGFTFGFLQAGPIAMMSELVMPQMRGNVVGVFALQWSVGGLFCNVGLQVLNRVAPTHYRNIMYSEWILVFLFAVCCFVTPESPPWLIKRGRIEDAKKHYRKLVGNVEGFDFEHEFAVIVQEVKFSQKLMEAQSKSEWRAVFRWKNLRRCLIVVLPYAGQSLCGGTYIGSYSTYFFQQAGLENPFLASVITSILSCCGIMTSIFLFDRVGRRPIMVYGTACLALFNFVIGGLAFIPINAQVGAGLITAASMWNFANSMSMSAIGWAAQGELTSPLLRAKSGGVIALIHSISKITWNYAVPQMISPQKGNWGAKAGLFFGGICVLWWIPIFFHFPETKGRSFAALDDLFDKRVSERKFHLTETPYDTPEFVERLHKRRPWWKTFQQD